MQNKKIGVCLLTAFALTTLWACEKSSVVETASSDEESDSDASTVDVAESATEGVLTVDESRCNGCGKCMQTDPEHFVLDTSALKAVVISQENLSSEDLQSAISGCHHSAISV